MFSLLFASLSVFTCWKLLGISKLLLPSAKKYSPKIESNWAETNDKPTFLSHWGKWETKSLGGLVHAEGLWNSDARQEVNDAKQQVFLECAMLQALRGTRYSASHWIFMWGEYHDSCFTGEESEVQIVTRLISGRTAIGIQDFPDSKTHAQKRLILRRLVHWQHRIQNVGNALV